MSRNEELFWELLKLPDAILVVDNDMCFVNYNQNEDGEYEHQSFDFGPTDLVFLFADKLGLKTELV